MIRAFVRSAILIAVAVVAARQAIFAGRDLARYNGMRAMSGEPPLLAPETKRPQTNAQARTTNALVTILSIPNDVQRYLKLKSM